MSLHVAITGATGFIGAAVTSELLSSGASVTVLSRQESNRARLSELSGYTGLTYSRLSDKQLGNDLSALKPDVFLHCGWRGVAGSERNEGFQFTDNIPSTIHSVELAVATGCRQWIGLGSQAEYGNLNQRLHEDAPVRPTTLYGKAKLAAGVTALGLCEAHKITGTWLRIFSTYGPGDSPNWFLPYVTQELIAGRAPQLTKCEQLWDYLYVTDFARAVIAVAHEQADGIFNVGSGTAQPLKYYVELIRTELGASLEPVYGAVPYRPDQVMHLEADISRLKEITGWSPEVGTVDGLREFVGFELHRPRTTGIPQ
jgi:UDP-glucose 4-epimerase